MEDPLAQHPGPHAPHFLAVQRARHADHMTAQRAQYVDQSVPPSMPTPQAQPQVPRTVVPQNGQNGSKRVHIADCIDFRRYGPGGCKRQQEGKECPFRHMDYTKRAGFCHQYDQSRGHFCSRGRDCKYYHASTRRTACLKFQSGQCPKAAHHCLYSHDPAICGMPPQMAVPQQGPRPVPTLENHHRQFGQNMQQRQFFGQQQNAMNTSYMRPQMPMPMHNSQFAFGGYPTRMVPQQYPYAFGFNGPYHQMMHPGMAQQFHGGNMFHQQHQHQHHSQQDTVHNKSEARELTDANHVVPPNTFKKWEDVRTSTEGSESTVERTEAEGTPEVQSPINNVKGFKFTLRMKEDIKDKAPVEGKNNSGKLKKDPRTPGRNEVMAAELRAKLLAKRELEASKPPEAKKVTVVTVERGPVSLSRPKILDSPTITVKDPIILETGTTEVKELEERPAGDKKRKRLVTPERAYKSDDEYNHEIKRNKDGNSPSSSSYVEEDSVDFDLDEF